MELFQLEVEMMITSVWTDTRATLFQNCGRHNKKMEQTAITILWVKVPIEINRTSYELYFHKNTSG